jgi:hypothetical protein
VKRHAYGLLGLLILTTLIMAPACKPVDPEPEPQAQPQPEPENPPAVEVPPEPPAPPDMTAMPVLLTDDVVRARFLSDSSLHYRYVETVGDALQLDMPAAVIDATPENLDALAKEQQKLSAFTDAGGWLMLWGLTPDGLAAFNKLVGVEHLIRPFETEEVSLPTIKDPLMHGIRASDLFMVTGLETPGVVPVLMRVGDAWSFAVDYDDIAPFCKFPDYKYWGTEAGAAVPGQPFCPRSLVNDLTYQWRWAFLIKFQADKPEYLKWKIEFPRTETPVQFSITPSMRGGNKMIQKVRLTYGKDAAPVELSVKELEERQDFDIPAREATSMTLEIAEWRPPAEEGIVGIMNLWIKVKRSPGFYEKVKPLLATSGVLMKYPQGKGGIVLNQMRVLKLDGTQTQKLTIFTKLIRNMQKN